MPPNPAPPSAPDIVADDAQAIDVPEMIASLLREELGFPEDSERVNVYNGKWEIPSSTPFFVVVGVHNEDNFGHGSGYEIDAGSGELVNAQRVAQSVLLWVDVFSADRSARLVLPDVLMALQGDAAERLMERESLLINRPEPFLDISAVEASRILNRFRTNFAVFRGAGRSKVVPSMIPAKNAVGKLIVQQ